MRLTKIWEDLCRINALLKYSTGFLALTNLISLVLVLKLSERQPLIIERECLSRALDAEKREVTPQEFEAFLKDAMAERFNSGENSTELLSVEETLAKKNDADELSRREMRQTVLVEKIEGNGQVYKVSALRLIALGSIRSAFPLELEVQIDRTGRTRGNPYGLVLIKSKLSRDDALKKPVGHSK